VLLPLALLLLLLPQLLAGLVGPATNWRVPFVIMAAPSLLLALLLIFTVQEPPRGGTAKVLCYVA
jgi:predicted MFS family arabinose efflux permease